MNKNDFGKFDSLKAVSEVDFSFSNIIINQEIYEGHINVYKYSFRQYTFTEENEPEIADLLPANNNASYNTKKLYWQAYNFFNNANYTLSKCDRRSQTLLVKNNKKPEVICDNSVRCGGYGWERSISYEYEIQCNLNQSNRFYWYFPYLDDNQEIQYCYLFELTDMGVNRKNISQRELLKKSAFNIDFSRSDSINKDNK